MFPKPPGQVLLLNLPLAETFKQHDASWGWGFNPEAMDPQEEHANHIGRPLISVHKRMIPRYSMSVGRGQFKNIRITVCLELQRTGQSALQ